ncbi:MAG: hypothetical protein H6704_06930 [Myxococcales bacterium]|nr:hypothetical protein [Myxococcales bacterium]MCB9535984.1 hypothetical protein [Myxococcales bacterium]
MSSKKKKRVKSKAAQVTAAKRAERVEAHDAVRRNEAPGEGLPEKVEFDGGGGFLTGMRGGFQKVASGGGAKKSGGWISAVLWLLVIAMVLFMFGGISL